MLVYNFKTIRFYITMLGLNSKDKKYHYKLRLNNIRGWISWNVGYHDAGWGEAIVGKEQCIGIYIYHVRVSLVISSKWTNKNRRIEQVFNSRMYSSSSPPSSSPAASIITQPSNLTCCYSLLSARNSAAYRPFSTLHDKLRYSSLFTLKSCKGVTYIYVTLRIPLPFSSMNVNSEGNKKGLCVFVR